LKNYIVSTWSRLVGYLPRAAKKSLLLAFDTVGLIFSFVSAVLAIGGGLSNANVLNVGIFFVFIAFFVGKLSGIYSTIIRFSGAHLLQLIVVTQVITTGITFAAFAILNITFPYAFYLVLFFTSVAVLGGGRLIARQLSYNGHKSGQRILIYGAGSAGIQLLSSLRQDWNYEVVAFIDDQNRLHGKTIHGLRVIGSSDLKAIVDNHDIDMIALAVPAVSRKQLRKIVNKIDYLGVRLKTVPKISDILGGQSSIGDLEEVDVEELLGRESVPPNETLLAVNITQKVVLVTGAGGSIGSELCRQIVTRSPVKLILVDHSELALYTIQEELEAKWGSLIKPILGSVCDQQLMRIVMKDESVDTVYHAAAYKHVPLVEFNPFAGIYNNVFGTQKLLQAAAETGVSSFMLISTDKAVRPTNVMGASKRLAEILCQLASANENISMRIAMVRFGNVLGSSGSVIPKFREQIKRGGPITVTHPEITRYFMIIPEAAQLVLQASSMADNGEVFLLDMGEPVKIADLAKKLIKLSGHVLSQGDEPQQGRISIEYTGLRPGEKLYEELLISGDAKETQHERIRKINEDYPAEDKFNSFLSQLNMVCQKQDEVALRDLLSKGEIGYSNKKDDIGKGRDDLKNSGSDIKYFEDNPYNGERLKFGDIGDLDQKMLPDNQNSRGKSKKETAFWATTFRKLLHSYFLISRSLTVGVRCVILNDHREVLLVKHTYIRGWHLPGGGLDSGESAEDGVVREVQEETGLVLEDKPMLLGVFHNKETTNRDHVVLFSSKTSKTSEMLDSVVKTFEIKSLEFFSLDALPIDLDPSSKLWIDQSLVGDKVNVHAPSLQST
jgi:FlaA1/EpsC-like NDP-sugar epimerase/ADP-ribose pyrophosphatase YjhB (NUDIX family)